MTAALRHGIAEGDGIRLHTVTQGTGPLVVLLHGFPEFWYGWRHQIPALAERFQVVACDLRGYGDSDKPPGVNSYRMQHLTSDVLGLIRACGETRARIVGHDWGGDLAWHLAMDHGEAVERLVVLNCPHPAILEHHLRSNVRQMLRSWYVLAFQIPELPEFLIRRFCAGFVERAFRGLAVRADTFSDADLERYTEALLRPGALTAALNYYRAAVRERRRRDAPTHRVITCPTLLIWGEDDVALGKELTTGMEPWFENDLKIQIVPECSHWVQHEQPELVNAWLLEFLA